MSRVEIPNFVMKEAKMTSSQKATYYALCFLKGKKPSVAKIALTAGLSTRSVRRTLSELADMGLVKAEKLVAENSAFLPTLYSVVQEKELQAHVTHRPRGGNFCDTLSHGGSAKNWVGVGDLKEYAKNLAQYVRESGKKNRDASSVC